MITSDRFAVHLLSVVVANPFSLVLASVFLDVQRKILVSDLFVSALHTPALDETFRAISISFILLLLAIGPCRLVVRSSRCGYPQFREDGGSNPPWDTFFFIAFFWHLSSKHANRLDIFTKPTYPSIK